MSSVFSTPSASTPRPNVFVWICDFFSRSDQEGLETTPQTLIRDIRPRGDVCRLSIAQTEFPVVSNGADFLELRDLNHYFHPDSHPQLCLLNNSMKNRISACHGHPYQIPTLPKQLNKQHRTESFLSFNMSTIKEKKQLHDIENLFILSEKSTSYPAALAGSLSVRPQSSLRSSRRL